MVLRGSAPPELEQNRVIGGPQGKSTGYSEPLEQFLCLLNTDLSLGELHACKLGRLR